MKWFYQWTAIFSTFQLRLAFRTEKIGNWKVQSFSFVRDYAIV